MSTESRSFICNGHIQCSLDTLSAQWVIRSWHWDRQEMGRVEREAFSHSRGESKKNPIASFPRESYFFPSLLRRLHQCAELGTTSGSALFSKCHSHLKSEGRGIRILYQCCVKALLSFSSLEAPGEAGLGLGSSSSSHHLCRIKDALPWPQALQSPQQLAPAAPLQVH